MRFGQRSAVRTAEAGEGCPDAPAIGAVLAVPAVPVRAGPSRPGHPRGRCAPRRIGSDRIGPGRHGMARRAVGPAGAPRVASALPLAASASGLRWLPLAAGFRTNARIWRGQCQMVKSKNVPTQNVMSDGGIRNLHMMKGNFAVLIPI